jgi:hypothetical protein
MDADVSARVTRGLHPPERSTSAGIALGPLAAMRLTLRCKRASAARCRAPRGCLGLPQISPLITRIPTLSTKCCCRCVRQVRRLVLREIRVLQSLAPHPNVCGLLEAFRTPSGRLGLVFPLMQRSALQVVRRCSLLRETACSAHGPGGKTRLQLGRPRASGSRPGLFRASRATHLHACQWAHHCAEATTCDTRLPLNNAGDGASPGLRAAAAARQDRRVAAVARRGTPARQWGARACLTRA